MYKYDKHVYIRLDYELGSLYWKAWNRRIYGVFCAHSLIPSTHSVLLCGKKRREPYSLLLHPSFSTLSIEKEIKSHNYFIPFYVENIINK